MQKELPVLTDADIGHVKKFTERFASLTKGRVRLWVIQQEFKAKIGIMTNVKPVAIGDLPRSEKKSTRIFDNRY